MASKRVTSREPNRPARPARTAPAAAPVSPVAAVHRALGNHWWGAAFARDTVAHGSGMPLPDGVRSSMEQAFAGAAVSPAPASAQGKSAVSKAGDAGEREADAIAARVAAGPAPTTTGGPDFGSVRVHTGPGAERAARSLSAAAYTVGDDVVFGAGQYQPDTPAGRSLIAHELTHVLQQRAGAEQVHRKEIDSSLAGGNRANVGPSDWLALDRQEWEILSLNGGIRSLSPSNTFMRAVFYNTQNVLPAEYTTVRQRHDYYDLISYVLEFDRNTPDPLRDIRFFHAATVVTGTPGVGSVDTALGAGMLGKETRQILRDVNEQLFALNMKVIHNLIFEWKQPRDPVTGAPGAIGGFDFDIRMVQNEQRTVENFITKNPSRFTGSVVSELNETLDPDKFGQFWNPSKTGFEWAKKALGVPALDFRNIDHRQAIGFAEVHLFHHKPYADYEAFVRARKAAAPKATP
ncbi:Uncharacterised protein [Amycolatopsis camponoti]|uniref:eCIS core domain-containing protein n=1 Tax=Amycolatopsis camponoti TaxID=2606593 RepID=A0A6I8LRF1_9PSEU|nr:DUF4157 domain-containing protein [Amycolatopsis camponoti]VVJ17659.1 Uncharacterised protein [Amycolatopsis camponoti]